MGGGGGRGRKGRGKRKMRKLRGEKNPSGFKFTTPRFESLFLALFFFLPDSHSKRCGQWDSAKIFIWYTVILPENLSSFCLMVLADNTMSLIA